MLLLNIVFHENNTASGGEFDREGKEGVKEKVTKDGRGEGAKLKFVFYVISEWPCTFFLQKLTIQMFMAYRIFSEKPQGVGFFLLVSDRSRAVFQIYLATLAKI